MSRRWICKAVGCRLLERYDYGCDRCGEYLYDGFLEFGWLGPVFNSRRWIKGQAKRFSRKCEVCSGKMFFTDDYCCSKKCYEDWCPF